MISPRRYDNVAAEADRELSYLTDDDWLAVAATVQVRHC